MNDPVSPSNYQEGWSYSSHLSSYSAQQSARQLKTMMLSMLIVFNNTSVKDFGSGSPILYLSCVARELIKWALVHIFWQPTRSFRVRTVPRSAAFVMTIPRKNAIQRSHNIFKVARSMNGFFTLIVVPRHWDLFVLALFDKEAYLADNISMEPKAAFMKLANPLRDIFYSLKYDVATKRD